MRQRIEFSVMTVDCLVCSPAFRRELAKINGVESLKELPLLNKIVVEYDSNLIDADIVKGEILKIASKTGLEGKLIFHGEKIRG
jgi:copper chaperone CopZ